MAGDPAGYAQGEAHGGAWDGWSLESCGEAFRRLFEEHTAVQLIIDPASGRILDANRAAATFLGWSRERLREMHIQEINVLPEEEVEREMARAREREQAFFEFRHRRADGSIRDVAVFSSPFTVEGRPLLFSTVHDVTAQKRSESQLREERNLLRNSLATPLVGILAFTADDRWLAVNDCACAMFGYTRAQLHELGYVDLSFTGDLPQVIDLLQRMLAGEIDSSSRERPFARRDGSTFWGVESLHCVRNAEGRVVQVVAFVKDIDDLKRTQERLAGSEALYRTVASHFPNGIVGLFDREHRMLLHDGTQSAFGAASGSLAGQRPSDFVPPAAAPAVEHAFAEALAGRPGHAEMRVKGRIFEVQTHPVRDDRGEVTMGLIMTEDVTTSRALQWQLEVKTRLAAIGTLVAGVAHEINNPLGGALASHGFVQDEVRRLRSRLAAGAPVDPAQLERTLDGIDEALEDAQAGQHRIAAIVKGLSVFGRADAARERVGLDRIVEAALAGQPPGLLDGLTVESRVEDAPEVIASEGQLVQVVGNLVSNAAHAIPRGRGGVVRIRTFRAPTGAACLEVEDDGTGMSAELAQRIFDPFFTTREPGKGMGLGLAIAHAIVSAHEGSIALTTEPGRGSTFRVELPPAAAS